MQTPKVSVIMPVYNTELYVSEAIKSIINQTLSDIEILIINDGSTDNSLNIINSLAKTEKRITVFTQNNQGQASARNYGLKQAYGKYIYFMDSDDLLDINALETCFRKCESEDLDFVFFNAQSFTNDNLEQINILDYHRTEGLKKGIYKGIDMLNLQLNKYQFKAPVWLNFIKREFLKDNDLKFNPPTSPHEDQLFSFYLYINAEKISFLDNPFFQRRLRHNSIMTTSFSWKNVSKYIMIADELISYAKDKSDYVQQTTDLFLSQMLNATVWNAYSLDFKERIKLLFICKTKYCRFVSNKTLVILLFKKYIS